MNDTYSGKKFVDFTRMFSMAFFLLALLTLLTFALPFITTGNVPVEKPIVSDGFNEAMSFDEMFPKKNFWR